jgi:ADP-ribosyltransferase exoenzyme
VKGLINGIIVVSLIEFFKKNPESINDENVEMIAYNFVNSKYHIFRKKARVQRLLPIAIEKFNNLSTRESSASSAGESITVDKFSDLCKMLAEGVVQNRSDIAALSKGTENLLTISTKHEGRLTAVESVVLVHGKDIEQMKKRMDGYDADIAKTLLHDFKKRLDGHDADIAEFRASNCAHLACDTRHESTDKMVVLKDFAAKHTSVEKSPENIVALEQPAVTEGVTSVNPSIPVNIFDKRFIATLPKENQMEVKSKAQKSKKAIKSYVKGSADINEGIWTGSMTGEHADKRDLILYGLQNMPPFEGTVYRAVEFGNEEFTNKLIEHRKVVGSIHKEHGFCSTSKVAFDEQAVSQFKCRRLRYVITSKTGRDLEGLYGTSDSQQEEREVLFAPGTEFKVTKYETIDDKHIFYMEECRASPELQEATL